MSNENTARRALYLPHNLDEWFVEVSDNTGKKVNSLIIEAMNDYKEKHSKSKRKENADFDKHVENIIENYLKKHGYDKL